MSSSVIAEELRPVPVELPMPEDELPYVFDELPVPEELVPELGELP
jgi:hypothetical protein